LCRLCGKAFVTNPADCRRVMVTTLCSFGSKPGTRSAPTAPDGTGRASLKDPARLPIPDATPVGLSQTDQPLVCRKGLDLGLMAWRFWQAGPPSSPGIGPPRRILLLEATPMSWRAADCSSSRSRCWITYRDKVGSQPRRSAWPAHGLALASDRRGPVYW